MFKAESSAFLNLYAQRQSSFRCIPCRNRANVKNITLKRCNKKLI